MRRYTAGLLTPRSTAASATVYTSLVGWLGMARAGWFWSRRTRCSRFAASKVVWPVMMMVTVSGVVVFIPGILSAPAAAASSNSFFRAAQAPSRSFPAGSN